MFDWVLNTPMQTDTLGNMWKKKQSNLLQCEGEIRNSKKLTKEPRIISIRSRHILLTNFHVPTFHRVSVSFPHFDSADRCLLTFLFKEFFFSNIRCDPVVTERYTTSIPVS